MSKPLKLIKDTKERQERLIYLKKYRDITKMIHKDNLKCYWFEYASGKCQCCSPETRQLYCLSGVKCLYITLGVQQWTKE